MASNIEKIRAFPRKLKHSPISGNGAQIHDGHHNQPATVSTNLSQASFCGAETIELAQSMFTGLIICSWRFFRIFISGSFLAVGSAQYGAL